jgi:hypothetical protein
VKPYKNGKHIQLRRGNGQFRQATLADLNIGTVPCPHCGALNPYTLREFKFENGFVDPARAKSPTKCSQCGAELCQKS